MTNELDAKLCTKYPKIFVDRHGEPRNTNMAFGFECGDGWYWLINRLCGRIQGYLDANPHLNIPQVVATQVKEKWGGLRFYITGADDTIFGAIDLAEHMSYFICEECGSTENVGSTTTGWIKTICKPCFDKSESPVKDREWKANKD